MSDDRKPATAGAAAGLPTVERFHGLDQPDSIELLLHLHRYEMARAFASGMRVLDYGCGDGYGSYLLAGAAASVLGVDVDDASIASARRRYPAPHLRYATLAESALDEMEAGSFDLIVCFEVIEHITEPEQERVASRVARLLATDGVLLMSTPNGEYKVEQYERFPDWRNPFHVRELSRDELQRLLARHFTYVSVHAQTIDVVSVADLPQARAVPVRSDTAWVNLAVASHSARPPVSLPFAQLPRSRPLIEALLLGEKSAHAHAAELERQVEALHKQVTAVTAELAALQRHAAYPIFKAVRDRPMLLQALKWTKRALRLR